MEWHVCLYQAPTPTCWLLTLAGIFAAYTLLLAGIPVDCVPLTFNGPMVAAPSPMFYAPAQICCRPLPPFQLLPCITWTT
jgi:hypothetical protein